ncbi:MAG: hypothetical protein AMDU5_GPLC00015G0026 [Thermoplasmatales archaeon Gpl]|nr:MAG: hypothetical protein AMDU5_GPLC00015G0026 [Thermoplasmatales archaeon Gpl]
MLEIECGTKYSLKTLIDSRPVHYLLTSKFYIPIIQLLPDSYGNIQMFF